LTVAVALAFWTMVSPLFSSFPTVIAQHFLRVLIFVLFVFSHFQGILRMASVFLCDSSGLVIHLDCMGGTNFDDFMPCCVWMLPPTLVWRGLRISRSARADMISGPLKPNHNLSDLQLLTWPFGRNQEVLVIGQAGLRLDLDCTLSFTVFRTDALLRHHKIKSKIIDDWRIIFTGFEGKAEV
jgi:hypothetical protein